MSKFLRNHSKPIIILATLSLIFFHQITLQGKVLFFGDTLLQRVPSMMFWKNQILSGHLPLWNPYIFAGIPHMADLSTNTFSPFNIAYLLINNPYKALSFLVVLQIFLAGIFNYFFLIELKLSQTASLLGAIIFAFSGTTLAAANDINSLQGIIFIPFITLLALRLVKNSNLKNITHLALGLLAQFISGHPQYSYYTWVFIAIFLLFFIKSNLIPKLKIIVLTFSLFLGLSAVQLLQFLELSKLVFRPTTEDFSTQNSLELIDLPRLLLSDIYGNWATGTSWGPNSPLETGRASTEGYLGIIPLILTLVALTKAKNPHVKFFTVMAALSLLLALGPTTPFYLLSRKLLPFFSKFRSPVRILSLYTFSVSLLASYGFDFIINQTKHAKSK